MSGDDDHEPGKPASSERWVLSIHGSTRLRSAEGEVTLRPRERGVLAGLAVAHPQPVSLLQLAELLWGEDIPRTYNKSLHNHVARIRRAADGVIETSGDGYRFSAAVVLDRSRPLGSGSLPFAELAPGPDVDAARGQQRFLADQLEDAHLIDLAGKEPSTATLTTLRAATSVAPLNETRWRLLAQTLARSGQRRDALTALDSARDAFVAAGLELSTELRDLERRIIDDDVALRGPVVGGAFASDANRRTIRVDDYRAQILPLLHHATATSTIELTGPAGIGKTTMADAILELAREAGFATYTTTCTVEPSVAFEPFTDLLRQGAERHPDELRRVKGADLLAGLIPDIISEGAATGEQADRNALFDAIAAAIRTDPRPTVIAIEDLHWASPFTKHLLAHCQSAPHGEGPPLVLVCTSRTSIDHPPDSTTTIDIPRWSVGETTEYVSLFEANPGRAAQWAEWVHQQTAGVALHVREMTLAILNNPDIVDSGRASHHDFPSLVAHLDGQRRALSVGTQRTISAAAVLGRTFAVGTLEQMIGDVTAALTEAEAAEVVTTAETPGHYRFRHDLLHHVAINAVSPGSLVELHDLATRALEATGSGNPGEIARHALAAAPLDRGRAMRHLLAAATTAAAQYSYEDAVESYLNARDLMALDSPDWCEATLAAGGLMARMGDERAQSFLRGAAAAALTTGDEELIARAILEVCRLGLTSRVGEVDERVRELLERALAMATRPGPRALCHTAGVGLYLVSGLPRTCRSHYLDAVEQAELAGDEDVIANVLGVTALALIEPGDLPRRRAAAARLESIGREPHRPATRFAGLHLRMSNEVLSGDPRMVETLSELSAVSAVLRQRSRDWEVTSWRATLALLQGDLEAAESHATAALDYTDAISESIVLASYGVVVLAIRVAEGRAAEMIEPLRATLEAQPTFGAWHATLAYAAAEAGEVELSRHHLDQTVANDAAVLNRDFTYSTALYVAANAAARLQDDEACRVIAEHLAPFSGTWVWMGTATLGPADLALAKLAAASANHRLAETLARSAQRQAATVGAVRHERDASELLQSLDR